jgi:hypothetical protein
MLADSVARSVSVGKEGGVFYVDVLGEPLSSDLTEHKAWETPLILSAFFRSDSETNS